jgi:hypothetical protein
MASTGTINTRIRLKYDTLGNWNLYDPQLLAGEVAIAVVSDVVDPITNVPAVVMKVGDGTKKFSELDFISAKAADVNSYAKLSDANFKSTIETWVSNKVQDTNTEYTIVKVNDSILSISVLNLVAYPSFNCGLEVCVRKLCVAVNVCSLC